MFKKMFEQWLGLAEAVRETGLIPKKQKVFWKRLELLLDLSEAVREILD
jgi:hypothetical protein